MDTIFIIDDHPDSAEVLTILAESGGFQAVNFQAYAPALEKICDGHKCCLLVVDIRVPGNMSAADFVKEVRKYEPDISVFIYSGVNNVDEVAHELSADGYCRKPCDPDHLLEEFSRACKNKGASKLAS